MRSTNTEKIEEKIQRFHLRDQFRQIDEQTLEARVTRYLEIDRQRIIGHHYFARASTECIDLYRDGHFIATVMATQAVNEGIFKFVAERNNIQSEDYCALLTILTSQGTLSQDCLDASKQIWGSFRNDVHHMNPKVAQINFSELAKKNIQNLALVEREVFDVSFDEGKLVPKYPKYWDIQPDGTVPIYLRAGI